MLPDDLDGHSWAEALQADADDRRFRRKVWAALASGLVVFWITAAAVAVLAMGGA
jgi:FtsH-binding integral membrane protein